VDGEPAQVNEKIEKNPRLLTCGYGVVFGRIEFISKIRGSHVPVSLLRSILLAPVAKFEEEYAGYRQGRRNTASARCLWAVAEACVRDVLSRQYLAQQLAAAQWGTKSYGDLCKMAVKKLESDYGNCLRAVVNKA
jgi:hypothetical protein